MKNLLHFHKCPFCRRAGSKIAVDTVAALSWQPPKLRVPELMINRIPSQPVVSFMPRREIVRPCDHLVYLLLDLEHKTGLRRKKALTLTWLHPRFLEGAPPFDKFGDMWETVVDKDDAADMLVTPFEVEQPTCSRDIRQGGKVVKTVECSGWTIYANDGVDLYEELDGVCGWSQAEGCAIHMT